MGMLGSKSVTAQDASFKDVVASYQRLRSVRLRLNRKLVRQLSKDVLNEGAAKLGILRDGVFVFDNEDETSVLMDYCIYDVFRNGHNAVEQHVRAHPTDRDSDEGACLRAMQDATYALVVVLDVEPGVGCRVRNLFTEDAHLLVDMGFSKTAQPGAVLATRLLNFGSFVITGGAALPVGLLTEAEQEEWQRTIRAGAEADGLDPAPLIRTCLQRGASSSIRYEEAERQRQPKVAGSTSIKTPSRRRKALARLAGSKSATNRRCRCGSGKMFKNCCGRR